MIIVKEISTPLDKMMLSSIIDHQENNIKMKNITFACDTIEDASGNVFIKQDVAKEDAKACQVEHFNSRHEGLAYISEMMNDLEHTYRDLQSWYASLKNEVYAYDPDSSDGHVNDIYYTAKELCQEANAIREQCEKWFVSFESHTGTDNEA